MSVARIRVVVPIVLAAVVTASGEQGPQTDRRWPPPIQPAPVESPVLPPAESMASAVIAPGFRLELVASEPLVQDPIFLTWDPDGRAWLIEAPTYMRDIIFSGQYDPIGRIVVLEDTNDDGALDKRTVFADDLVLPRSLAVLDRGVLVAEPPNVWLMHDTNGDLQQDAKELVTDNFGRLEASFEHNANGFHWALDNWMYAANSDVFLRLKNGAFEVVPTVARGQWGVTHDDAGRIYRNSNESVLHVDLVPTSYFLRNPNLLRTRGSYESMRDEEDSQSVVWPVRPTPGLNRAYQFGVLREDGRLAKFTSASAPTVYRGDRFPPEVYGNMFIAEPAANMVARLILSDDGTSVRARKAYDNAEFLSSTDERFRPVNLANAPDGTLYIVDMYRGIIQQRSDITEYLRDEILSRRLEQPTGLGRIYRVVHDTTQRGPRPALSGTPAAELVSTLSHPNGWWRDTAQRLLVERADRSVAPALTNLATTAPDFKTRLHALWTLDGIDAIEPATVATALEDASRDVRASAVRIAERWLPEAGHPIHAAVLKRLDDADWAVRQQLAASIGFLPAGPRETAAASVLDRGGADPVTVDAALSSVRGSEGVVLEHLLQRGEQAAGREDAIVMTAATLVRGAQDAGLQRLFGWIGESSRPEWQRAALLRGTEVALLNAPMPGQPGRRGGGPNPNAPCPTCPGARGGPRGAYAFPGGPTAPATQFVNPFTKQGPPPDMAHTPPEELLRQAEVTPPIAQGAARRLATVVDGRGAAAGGGGGGRGGRGGANLRVGREPVPLSALAAGGGELGTRAAAVLARVDWPGKPGAAVPVPPLTELEQQRFAAGQEVYKTICIACHQADGRGQDRIAPSLVGSTLTLATPGVGARIVLHGKEGPVGVMPPLGPALSDDQIAGVLTYIRREWGQTASPVDPAAVREVRGQTSGRSRPWTQEELDGVK